MDHSIITGIVLVLVLGIGSQWLAWQFRVPSILLLLIVGFVAGPVTGVIDPAGLQEDWVFAFVSISIGVILFEGGLSLRLSELREIGGSVLNLITIGVLLTWLFVALAAYFVVGMNVTMSIQIGAILTVTGPTVVIPLLRHVRPTGRVRAIAKWEGITIDPVGAILAVLVLDTILILNEATASGVDLAGWGPVAIHAMKGLLLTITTSIGISALGAGLLIVLLRRRMVPDYLQSSVALAIVVGTFALSNVLQEESGLLEVTLLGIIMANQRLVPVRRISDFKEDLQVLLIASLFIVLSARLELSALEYINGRTILFLVILILVVRPIVVWVSSVNTKLTGKEIAFLSWIAPRGIVAAAVASLFSFQLAPIYPDQAESLVPIVFMVIVGTVAVYGLTLAPVARYLGLADPNPSGFAILGAHSWARKLALVLQDHGFKVLIIDSNTKNVDLARQQGLPAEPANAVSEAVLDDLDLSGIGNFLAITSNDEVNTLAVLNFTEIFESNDVYQLDARVLRKKHDHAKESPSNLRGRPLFGRGVTFMSLTEMFDEGGQIESIEVTDGLSYEMIKDQFDDESVLLFVIRGEEALVSTTDMGLSPSAGDTVVLFVPARFNKKADADGAVYGHLVASAAVLDLEESISFEEVVDRAAAEFAVHLPIPAAKLAAGFSEMSKSGAMPVAGGVALPHFRLSNIQEPILLIVRSKTGIKVESENSPEKEQTVHAVLFHVSPEDRPGQHLRTLANLASRIDDENFMESWVDANGEQQLKEVLLPPDKVFHGTISADRPEYGLGMSVAEFQNRSGTYVVLLTRNGKTGLPDSDVILKDGDEMTVSGDKREIARIVEKYKSRHSGDGAGSQSETRSES